MKTTSMMLASIEKVIKTFEKSGSVAVKILVDRSTLVDKREDALVSTIQKRKRGRPPKKVESSSSLTGLIESTDEITQKEPLVSELINEGT